MEENVKKVIVAESKVAKINFMTVVPLEIRKALCIDEHTKLEWKLDTTTNQLSVRKLESAADVLSSIFEFGEDSIMSEEQLDNNSKTEGDPE